MGEKTIVLACSEQFLQVGKIDPVVFLVDKSASKYSGGFNWNDSILGRSFWVNVLLKKKYHLANMAYDTALKIFRENLVE